VLIGEIYLPVDRLVAYYGPKDMPGAHLPFNFQLVLLPWDARRIETAVAAYEGALPAHGWPNWVLGNHDRMRIATKAGPEQAGNAVILLLTLRGTPTLYYGDEIGLEDVPSRRRWCRTRWRRTCPAWVCATRTDADAVGEHERRVQTERLAAERRLALTERRHEKDNRTRSSACTSD
jgi:alpha-glucosidase